MVRNSGRFEVSHEVLRDRDQDYGRGRMPEFIPLLKERTDSSGSSCLWRTGLPKMKGRRKKKWSAEAHEDTVNNGDAGSIQVTVIHSLVHFEASEA